MDEIHKTPEPPMNVRGWRTMLWNEDNDFLFIEWEPSPRSDDQPCETYLVEAFEGKEK